MDIHNSAIHEDNPLTADLEASEDAQQSRLGAYALLASLLRTAPSQDLINHLAKLPQDDNDALASSIASLALASQKAALVSLEDAFNKLFIGLGRGELVPYGSWYLTGFLMEKPLGQLRKDLITLGYERDAEVYEPEDHAAALCEVMMLMIEDGRDINTQHQFFSQHISSWMGRFSDDLAQTKSSSFYQAVGRFAAAFIAFESEYLGIEV